MFTRASNINDLYLRTVGRILRAGRPVSPRGEPTIELFPAQLVLTHPRARVLTVEGRIINPAFAAAEALWVVSGSDSPWIYDFNSRLTAFADDGVLRGAYGPRLRRWSGHIDQLAYVRDTILHDPDTRRAVIQLFDPAATSTAHKDVPCTVGYRFLLRDGRLNMFVTMRSQDAWLGLPYDIFTNTVLHELMAGWVGAALGTYHHFVDSLHLYARDLTAARRLRATGSDHEPTDPPLTVSWEQRDALFADACAGTVRGDDGLRSLALCVRSYRHWKQGDRGAARAMADDIPGDLGVALRRWYAHLAPHVACTGAR
jgi:thymidylate synthase